MKRDLSEHPGWKWCTFEGAELHSLMVGMEKSLREKILWMEDQQTIHSRLSRRYEKGGGVESPSPEKPNPDG
jgi:hypothetical protein